MPKPKSIFDLDVEKRQEAQELLKEQINAKVNNEPAPPAATSSPAAPEDKKKTRRTSSRKERMNIVLPAETKEKLEAAAFAKGLSASVLLQLLIDEHL